MNHARLMLATATVAAIEACAGRIATTTSEDAGVEAAAPAGPEGGDGADDSCASLLAALETKLEFARRCSPSEPPQCGTRVDTPCCPTFVATATSRATIDYLQALARFETMHCSVPTCDCVGTQPVSGTCRSGRCEE